MKTDRHFWLYRAQFLLEWEVFQTEILDKFKTNILWSSNFFFPKILPLMDKVEK